MEFLTTGEGVETQKNLHPVDSFSWLCKLVFLNLNFFMGLGELSEKF